jgi:S-adenosylmethionine:tRNA ribosyltransferase-isomerase
MRTDLFDYHLPQELIAPVPAERREDSRLLVVRRRDQSIEHAQFRDIGRYLCRGDMLVVNDSRVIRARLHGKRLSTGGTVEFLLLERASQTPQSDTWRILCRPAKKLKPGETVYFANKRLTARITHHTGAGEREAEFDTPDIFPWLDQIGEVPLPPYIVQRRREIRDHASQAHDRIPTYADEQDVLRYQTVYARENGSVAAPTAGLHFSEDLLAALRSHVGVELASVTLHVGAGTFRPVETEEIEAHPMHSEQFTIPEDTAQAVNRSRDEGRRIVAVGTTSVRTLESSADDRGHVCAGSRDTRMMIVPGYCFRVVDAMVTNFHLPRSTLLMLVCAFSGRELILRAYEEAIRERYRFFSYGDAMLLLP